MAPPKKPGRAAKAQRTASSRRWLERQHRDPFVAAAKAKGYRSRAAFKLIEIDDKFRLLAPGRTVLDLGAAPGGWSQVAAERVNAASPHGGTVVAVDLIEIDAIGGVDAFVLDLHETRTGAELRTRIKGGADVVLSDMAPAATGHRGTDHLRAAALAEAALATAGDVLKPGGAFVVKVLRSGADAALQKELRARFREVRAFKPKASRQDSAEIYLVARGFRPISATPAA